VKLIIELICSRIASFCIFYYVSSGGLRATFSVLGPKWTAFQLILDKLVLTMNRHFSSSAYCD